MKPMSAFGLGFIGFVHGGLMKVWMDAEGASKDVWD